MDNNVNHGKAEKISEEIKLALEQMMKSGVPMNYNDIVQSTNDFYQKINPIDVQNKIRRFRRLNFKTISDNDLFNEIMNVLCVNGYFAYPTNIKTIGKGSIFFRVRKLRGEAIPFENFKEISDMWEPPKEKITKMERLNKPGESLLYTTLGDPNIAIKEARIQDGNRYALMKYIANNDIKINVIGGDYDTDNLPFTDSNSKLVFSLINDFLRDEFSREVGEGTEYLYRISEHIAKDWFDLPPDTQDAWAYSSIQDKQIYNVCFRPEKAHTFLELQGALICKKEANEMVKAFAVTIPSIINKSIEYYPLGSEIQKELFPEIVLNGDSNDQL